MYTQRDTQTQKQSRSREKDSQTNTIASVKLRGEFDPLAATNTQSNDLILCLNTQEIRNFRIFLFLQTTKPLLRQKLILKPSGNKIVLINL